MLSHIHIKHYTIVEELEMEFIGGMTVVTGETGAGKSIMLDALGLCLGDRADPKTVSHGQPRAEISASFDISDIPSARRWLQTHDLDGDDCILRRVVTSEGRSRAFINGSPSTLADCAELGDILIDIHSQHAHQSLLRRDVQRQQLDHFAGSIELARDVEACASDWLRSQRELELLTAARDDHSARAQLLSYQVGELDDLALGESELVELEAEQNRLANAEQILTSAHQVLQTSEEQQAALHRSLQLLDADLHRGPQADSARELLDSAAIQVSEARDEVQRYLDGIEVDPSRLNEVERRLESIYDIARKHRVKPEDVSRVYQELREELGSLAGGDDRIEALALQVEQLAVSYGKAAGKLSKKRRSASRKLVKAVEEKLAMLSMGQCKFEISLSERESANPHPQGAEDVEYLISTNPGTPTQSLGKIASGGELSRISLAIQVVTASSRIIPSMVFDEVDVGIGGAVAEVVGGLLRDLGQRAQVLCVTHLPQVASQGHRHLQVSKSSDSKSVTTHLQELGDDERVEEIARMLGGRKITAQTRAHAREMLDTAAES